MDEHYKKGIHRIKKLTESVKRRSEVYSGLAKIDDGGTASSLRCLQKVPSPGKKLQKIGFIIFWIPEPTMISNAVAVPMILGGRYLEKVYNSSTISDVGHETKNNIGTIKGFRDAIN
ncbi:MAG TPA: hypothetical protein VD699_01240 [Nitrosopumilaceae archaeon]|nr:hypothetical protein [Nitrosopumilaceae archaeon]